MTRLLGRSSDTARTVSRAGAVGSSTAATINSGRVFTASARASLSEPQLPTTATGAGSSSASTSSRDSTFSSISITRHIRPILCLPSLQCGGAPAFRRAATNAAVALLRDLNHAGDRELVPIDERSAGPARLQHGLARKATMPGIRSATRRSVTPLSLPWRIRRPRTNASRPSAALAGASLLSLCVTDCVPASQRLPCAREVTLSSSERSEPASSLELALNRRNDWHAILVTRAAGIQGESALGTREGAALRPSLDGGHAPACWSSSLARSTPARSLPSP